MGTLHAETLRRLENADLVAVAAVRPGRAAEVGKTLGVDACTYDELFARSDIDAIVLAARSVDHGRLAVRILESGKHLFLEKPGATTLAEHEALSAAGAARPQQVVHVGYMRRYDDAFLDAYASVQRGDIGEPLVVVVTSRDMEWPEGEDPHDTGGFLLDMASHDYDTACWFLGAEPVEVHAVRQARVYPELRALGDLDNGVVTIRFDNDSLATTLVSRTSSFGHDIRCEVVGTDGSVFVRGPGDGRELVISRRDAHRFPADYRARFFDAYERELRAFVDACQGGDATYPTLADDRRAVAIGIAARAAAVDGEPKRVGVDWAWR